MGLINCLRKESGGEVIRGILIQDPQAPKFSFNNPLYSNQLKKDLVINVLRVNGVWGSYRHLSLTKTIQKTVSHAFIEQMSHGDLNSLRWIEGPLKFERENKNLVQIHFSSLNFK